MHGTGKIGHNVIKNIKKSGRQRAAISRFGRNNVQVYKSLKSKYVISQDQVRFYDHERVKTVNIYIYVYVTLRT